MNIKNAFILSIVLEQIVFLYFSFNSFSILGARLLQLIILPAIIFLNTEKIYVNLRKIDFISVLFFLFLALGLFIGLINLYYENYQTSFSQNVLNSSSSIQSFITIARETIVYIYMFTIFVFIFNRLLNKREDLLRFFKLFRIIFLFSLFIGYFLFIYYYFFNTNLLPRQLNYGFQTNVDVGLRFMGLFGEPRDAMVCLAIGLGIISLEQLYLKRLGLIKFYQRSYYFYSLLTLLAFYFTDSGSSIIAILLFLLFLTVHLILIIKLNLKTIFFILMGILYLSLVLSSSRTEIYYYELLRIPDYMSGIYGEDFILFTQFNNILPIWLIIENAFSFNLLPVIYGNGFGSSAFVSFSHLGEFYTSQFENPHAQISRLIFETGIIGSFLWYLLFIIPIIRLRKSVDKKEYIYISAILIFSFGSLLAHRNPEMFLLIGVLLAVRKHFLNLTR